MPSHLTCATTRVPLRRQVFLPTAPHRPSPSTLDATRTCCLAFLPLVSSAAPPWRPGPPRPLLTIIEGLSRLQPDLLDDHRICKPGFPRGAGGLLSPISRPPYSRSNRLEPGDMASSINFNQFLEKEKLKSNGSNFTDWFRHVRIFLNGGNLQYVLDAPLGDPPAETETDEVKNVYMTRKTRYSQVRCAILCSLESDLQKRFEHHDPHELIKELKTIFETHAAVECYEASKHFFSCMMEEEHEQGVSELFGMLKAAEIEIKKEHQVLMVNKTTSFKKQGKSKGKNKKSGKKAATPL
ncbi:hypothetical protein QYE76_024429 [Lolium multiflorum]|uniref:Uncharacterized protein n=1 Tax=Lolium multiflorum TaxID=4521 RepID=A0AAD8RET6_LOLMU|nr:hypothetical protein QYE76_024429 [Lolium multiflorum]